MLLPSYVTSSEFHAQLMYEKNMNSLEVLLLYSRVTRSGSSGWEFWKDGAQGLPQEEAWREHRAVGPRPEAAPPGAVQDAEAQATLRSRTLGSHRATHLHRPPKKTEEERRAQSPPPASANVLSTCCWNRKASCRASPRAACSALAGVCLHAFH